MKRETRTKQQRLWERKSCSYRCLKLLTIPMPLGLGSRRHYFDGTHIIMDGYVYAYNGTNEPCSADAWFRHARMDAAGFNVQIAAPSKSGVDFDTGDTYGPYSSNSMLDFPVGRPMGPEESYRMNAHIHLVVGNNETTDVWHDNEWTETFDSSDNP